MNLTSALTDARRPIGISAAAVPHPGLELIDSEHPRRSEVERFIARRFREMHAALISEFMPELIALCDSGGRILAAVGMRSAADTPLFLEFYLQTPVENAIENSAERIRPRPQRERIVEIGNLASIDRRASRRLFGMLASLLNARHFEWAVFTGCTSLHRMFKTLGIETIDLGRALQSQLPAEQQTWGSYYEDSPRVVAGRVSRGCLAFAGGELESDRAVA